MKKFACYTKQRILSVVCIERIVCVVSIVCYPMTNSIPLLLHMYIIIIAAVVQTQYFYTFHIGLPKSLAQLKIWSLGRFGLVGILLVLNDWDRCTMHINQLGWSRQGGSQACEKRRSTANWLWKEKVRLCRKMGRCVWVISCDLLREVSHDLLTPRYNS